MVVIGNDWDEKLKNVWNGTNFNKFLNSVYKLYDEREIYPKKEDIFNSLKKTPFKRIKVVILGQDPYHEEGQAMGLSFSVPKGIAIPASLRNIFKELESDLGITAPQSGDLTKWAKQGVLLLNSSLTVEKGKANSHTDIGWQVLTDLIIRKINEKETPVVFILWGSFARNKKKLITNPIHFVIESAHPSPLSAYRGFFGSKPFSKTNEFLKRNNISPINWDLK